MESFIAVPDWWLCERSVKYKREVVLGISITLPTITPLDASTKFAYTSSFSAHNLSWSLGTIPATRSSPSLRYTFETISAIHVIAGVIQPQHQIFSSPEGDTMHDEAAR